MATGSRHQATANAPALYRFDVGQVDRMIDAGVFRDEDHVELLEGVLVAKMTKHQPHNISVGKAANALRRTVPAGWTISEEKAVLINRRTRPEPDIAVIRGSFDDYPVRPPGPKDIAILVEVSDSTYRQDRGLKWRLYASARVALYWIVNLATRQVEVYSAPTGRGKSASYAACTTFAATDEVPVVVEGVEVGRVRAADLLA